MIDIVVGSSGALLLSRVEDFRTESTPDPSPRRSCYLGHAGGWNRFVPLPALDELPTAIVVTVSRDHSPRDMRVITLEAMSGAPRDMVLDLRAADRVDDLELALLVGIRARQRSHGRALTLVCGPESTTRKALSRAGLGDHFATVTELPSQARLAIIAQRVGGHPAPPGDGAGTEPDDAWPSRRDAPRRRS